MKRILVVDGDTGVRARIAKHARMEGYDVTEAGDGETALSLSRQQNAFDLMVLAVNLPGMDGFTVLKAVRTFSAIPVSCPAKTRQRTASMASSWGRTTI